MDSIQKDKHLANEQQASGERKHTATQAASATALVQSCSLIPRRLTAAGCRDQMLSNLNVTP